MKTIRVVTTKRASIADIIHNYRTFSREFKKENPPQCVCHSTGEHKILTPEDLPPFPGRILMQNAKSNIPHPSKVDRFREGYEAILRAIQHLEKLMSQWEQNKSDFLPFPPLSDFHLSLKLHWAVFLVYLMFDH